MSFKNDLTYFIGQQNLFQFRNMSVEETQQKIDSLEEEIQKQRKLLEDLIEERDFYKTFLKGEVRKPRFHFRILFLHDFPTEKDNLTYL
jgi:hypothetical protein